VPALVLNRADSIRFTLAGKPVGKAEKPKVRTIDVTPGPKLGFTLVVDRASAQSKVSPYNSEAEMWAGLASLAAQDVDRLGGDPKKGQFDLVITLVIANTVTKQMDAWRFTSEIEMLRGLAEFAAGKLADLALEMHGREEGAGSAGRVGR
jgi:hypothetical protein